MKIITCIKQVPDSEAKVTAQNGQVSWEIRRWSSTRSMNTPVEAALQQKDRGNATVTALCIGQKARGRRSNTRWQWAADEAVLVSDPALETLDSQGAARVLALPPSRKSAGPSWSSLAVRRWTTAQA